MKNLGKICVKSNCPHPIAGYGQLAYSILFPQWRQYSSARIGGCIGKDRLQFGHLVFIPIRNKSTNSTIKLSASRTGASVSSPIPNSKINTTPVMLLSQRNRFSLLILPHPFRWLHSVHRIHSSIPGSCDFASSQYAIPRCQKQAPLSLRI